MLLGGEGQGRPECGLIAPCWCRIEGVHPGAKMWDTEAWENLQRAQGCLLPVWNGLSHSLVLPLKEMAFPSCACGLGLQPVLSARNLLVGNLRGGRDDYLLYRLGNRLSHLWHEAPPLGSETERN